MDTRFALGLILAFASAAVPAQPSVVLAQDAAAPIVVSQPWLRATPKGASVAGGYATITNRGSAPDRLVGASLAIAPQGNVHTMSMADGVMHMQSLADGLPIASGQTVTLAPGGNHLMFMNPTAQLKQGETMVGTLTFAKAGTVPVTFYVAGLAAKTAPGQAARDMTGMEMEAR